MSTKIKKVRPNIQVGGTQTFVQEVMKGQKFRFIGFEEGKCHRRVVVTTTIETQEDPVTGDDIQVSLPGYSVLHMMRDMLGVPVNNPGYESEGIDLEPDYTSEMYNKLIAEILNFQEDANLSNNGFSYKTIYSNLIKYVENFANNFNTTKNPNRSDIILLQGAIQHLTPEQQADPTYDHERAIILNFKEKWNQNLGQKPYKDIFKMTFDEAVKDWITDNTSYKIPYTMTANANFTGVPFYGALPDVTTEEGEHQTKVINALAGVARVLSQHNFENDASGKATGLTRGTEAYYKIYNEWVGEPRTNRQLVQRPALNGLIFVLDSICNESCNQLLPDKNGNTKMTEHIHGVSKNKLEKMDKVKAYDSTLVNPDFIDMVFKYTTGDSKAQMGMNMSCARWEGPESTKVPFKDVRRLIDQTNDPTMPDRINTYSPFPFDQFVESFRNYLIKLNENDGLSWIKQDEDLLNQVKYGFELIDFDIDSKEVSVETLLTTTGPAGASLAGLGISINAAEPKVEETSANGIQGMPVPQPSVPQPDVPQPSAPQPDVPQPSAPQPEVPQPDVPQPSAPQPAVPQPDVTQV